MCNQQPSPIVRYGRFRELTATTLWQGKGKFQPLGNFQSVTAQVTVPIQDRLSPALLCVLPFSLKGGIYNEKFLELTSTIITLPCLPQISRTENTK